MGKLPKLDVRMQQIIKDGKLGAKEVLKLHSVFKKYDRTKTGWIAQDEFHAIIKDDELLFFFGMCLFDLVDARNYKKIDFSDFAYGLITFSLFGTEELLRFGFNCFDPERNGTIDLEDYNVYTRLLHARNAAVHDIAGLGSNVATVLERMEKWVVEDKKIDYDEWVESNNLWPWILKPLEKFRRIIRDVTFGNDWWANRVEKLHYERQDKMEVLYLAERRKKKWENERERRAEHMKIRRRMGKLLFYCCPLLRIIFAFDCWDPKRSANKLRNDLIKNRIENRYETDMPEPPPPPPAKKPKKKAPRLEQKMAARQDKREDRRALRGLSRNERAARNKAKRGGDG